MLLLVTGSNRYIFIVYLQYQRNVAPPVPMREGKVWKTVANLTLESAG